jgi:limonene-1,2-epoxide hydrolase
MGDSPESLVRKFFAAWADPRPDELDSFFHDAAVWVDGPQGVRRGAEAIKSELATQLKAVGGVIVRGHPISAVVMAVFELDAEGRIKQWREPYDLKSMMDQIKAAAF